MIHSIIATWAIDKARKRDQALSPPCPKCHDEQVAPEKKINEPVACRKCGAEIPPQPQARQGETQHNRE